MKNPSLSVRTGSALGALFSPAHAETFINDYWPKRLFFAQLDPEQLPIFFQSDALQGYESLAAVYEGQLAITHRDDGAQMLPASKVHAAERMASRATVMFEDIGAQIPGADEFLLQLETELGINYKSTVLSAWASASDSGVGCHYDSQDVISVHLKGQKRWEVAPATELLNPVFNQYSPGTVPRDELYSQMRSGFPSWEGLDFQTIDMVPGSILYIPRGTWHRTMATGETLAVTINLNPATGLDAALEVIKNILAQDPKWREPLYGVWGNDAQRKAAMTKLNRCLASLPKMTLHLKADDLFRIRMTSEQLLGEVTRSTWFQRIPHRYVSPQQVAMPRDDITQFIEIQERDDQQREATFNGMELPQSLVHIVEWFGNRDEPFSAAMLNDQFKPLPFDVHQQLLEMGTRAGLLKVLWYPVLNSAKKK